MVMNDVTSDEFPDYRSNQNIGRKVIQTADTCATDCRCKSIGTYNNERLVVVFARHDGGKRKSACPMT
jgi:hypothetical protein